MKILAIEQDVPGADDQAMRPHLRDEARQVWALLQGEVLREIWFTREDHRAVLILECKDEAEAKRHLATLPLVREKLITFQVFGLAPYDGLERLFSAAQAKR